MEAPIKLLGDTKLPKYETPGSCGFDLAARETTVIKARSLGLIPTGIIVKVPHGYMLLVASRSSTPKKFGLLMPHGIGILDQDYHGDTDELLLQFYNFTDNDVTIEKGLRIGQGVFVRSDQAQFIPSEHSLRDGSRGGFGSTKH